jgi:hypothetical protein
MVRSVRSIKVYGVALSGALLLLPGCGQDNGSITPAAGTEHAEPSCADIREELKEAEDVLRETFGSGEEGHEARMAIVGAVDEHPDCFDEREHDVADHWRDQGPYESEADPPVEE